MTKMTYVAALNYVLTNVADLPEDVAEKLTALKEQTEKRNAADRKPTKRQIENADLAEKVVEVLANAADPLTVTEIMGRDETLAALSNQKVSALIRGLGARVVKTVDKRVSKFSLA
jgi:sugar-specific transcriptional regulator TrmB